MPRRVRLSIDQLRRILAWAEDKGTGDFDVEIKVSHDSGIGPSVKAAIETSSGEGVYKDFTELDKW